MKKIIIFLVTFFVLFISFGLNVNAVEQDKSISDPLNSETVEKFYKQVENSTDNGDLLKKMNPRDFIKQYAKSGSSGFSVNAIIDMISKTIFKELLIAVKVMIAIIVIAIISSLLKNLEDAFTNTKVANIAFYSCYVLIILLLTKSFVSSVQIAKDTIGKLTEFMTAIMPVMIFFIASVGGAVQAATMDPVVLSAVSLTPKIYLDFLIPLTLMSFVLCFVNNISTEHKVEQLAKLIKQITLWAQGIVLTVFIGLISIRSMTSSTLDAVTLKTAKYAVDNFIPIVGKALSDSISTIAGYCLILKNAFGVFGLIMIILYFLFPVIKMLAVILVYRISASVIEPIVDKRIVSCISGAADSLMLVCSMLLCVSMMFFVLLCIMVNTGKFIVGG